MTPPTGSPCIINNKISKKRKTVCIPSTASTRITLKVRSLQDNSKIFFEMRRSAKVQELVDFYCARHGVREDGYGLLFNGRSIAGQQTLEEVRLVDGDEIFLVPQQPESTTTNATSSREPASDPSATSFSFDHKINVTVRDLKDGSEVSYRVSKGAKLQRLMDKHCARLGDEKKDSIWFLFEGRVITGFNTPDELGLCDGDVIRFMKGK